MSVPGPSAVAVRVRPAKITVVDGVLLMELLLEVLLLLTAVDGVLPMKLLLLLAKITIVEEDRGWVKLGCGEPCDLRSFYTPVCY
jgi:hypothetical protein